MCRSDDFPPFDRPPVTLKRAADVRLGDRTYGGRVKAIIRTASTISIAIGPAPSPWMDLAPDRLVPVIVR